MDKSLKDIFFQLLRIGLWANRKPTFTHSLNESDWVQIHKYAVNHTVEGLLYDSFAFLDEHQLPPQKIRLMWTVRVDKIERHNQKMNAVIASQYKIFKENGLNPLLQKGQGVALCYEVPLHRMSGDIDWYFENNGYNKARNFIKEKKMSIRDTAGFSLSYDWHGIHIEHHKKLFDIQSPFKSRFLRKIQKDHKDNYQTLLINDVYVRLLPHELQLLQVNSHILKHLLSFGIGLRQLCDSARLYYCTFSEINKKNLKELYRNAGILDWIHLLHYILVQHIGLPEKFLPFELPPNLNADWMLEEIWYSGNFGFHDPRFKDGKISQISRQPDGAHRLWSNFRRYIKYAPQEAFFFPIVQTYSRFIGKDKD